MILQLIYKQKEYYQRLKGSFWKMLLYSSKVSIGKSLQLAEFPKLTLLKNYTLQISDNVNIGKNVDLRVYNNSTLIIEKNCKIDDGVRIIAANGSTVHIKENTKIGFYSVLNGGGSIIIGSNSSTYGFVYIQSSSHVQTKETGFQKEVYTHDEINIGSNVLLGSHSVVMPGVTIDKNHSIDSHQVINK